MRQIDADSLKEDLTRFYDGEVTARQLIDEQPTVEPIKGRMSDKDDCISRQWLMECVSEGWIKFDTKKDENRFMHLVRDIAPSVQPEPKWIPCSERLPEKNCRCLTTNEAWGSFEVDWNAWIDGQWLYPNEKPIAWMPMPEPYRGGDSE